MSGTGALDRRRFLACVVSTVAAPALATIGSAYGRLGSAASGQLAAPEPRVSQGDGNGSFGT